MNTKQKICSIGWCDRPAMTKGWCRTHYERSRNGTDMDKPIKYLKSSRGARGLCTVEGCERLRVGGGLCDFHYRRKLKGTSFDLPYQAHDGQPFNTGGGYMQRTCNGERILEHRYQMQKYLKRSLLPDENVHHKNGDRKDNRIENLELWSRSQPPGQRVGDKIAWAEELLATYAENTWK